MAEIMQHALVRQTDGRMHAQTDRQTRWSNLMLFENRTLTVKHLGQIFNVDLIKLS